jgi:diaminopimelate epimerase
MVPFTKASACGNDFLIIEGNYAPADMSAFTRRICDRHNGVGADGVEWVFPSARPDAAVDIRLINADGTEAEISGNGTRCVAAWLVSEGGHRKVSIRTGAGVKICELVSSEGDLYEFETDMGSPGVEPDFALRLGSTEVRGTPVSMGNPHYVVFVTEFPPAWQTLADEIQRQPCFTQGVNVELVRVKSATEIEALFYERGAGETQSSGTGSCASAVAAVHSGKVKSPVSVHAPGGTQVVRWTGANIVLRGPAQLVCRGEFLL